MGQHLIQARGGPAGGEGNNAAFRGDGWRGGRRFLAAVAAFVGCACLAFSGGGGFATTETRQRRERLA